MKFFFLFCFFFSTQSFAQTVQPNLKFGSPTQEELTMTTYAPDPEAAAVMLYRNQEVYYDIIRDNFAIVYEVKVRIKVLKSEGTDEANVTIPYFRHVENGKMQEEIYGLKATSYNMENGQVVKTKMKNEQIFDERIDKDRMLKKFTVPQVREGTVFEYEYKLLSEYYYTINDWYAQSSIPTLYTSYKLTIPEWFQFNVEQTGWERLENQRKERNFKFSIYGELLPCDAMEYSFTGQQLPAVHPDGFVWCVGDYMTKVTTELSQLKVPNSYVKNFTLSWEDVVKSVMDDSDFGSRLKRKNPLKQEMEEAGIPAIEDPQEKILATIRLLQSRVRWNGKYDLWASNQPLKEGTGSNADMNFLLIQMLKDAGIETFPVLLRRRDSGRLPLTHPTLQAFNTFIVAAPVGEGQVVYVDPSSTNGFLNVLPSDLLVQAAYSIRDTEGEKWVDLQHINKGRTSTIIEAKVAADGKISGTVTTGHFNNAALSFRENFKNAKDSVTFVREMAEREHIQILDYQLTGHRGYLSEVEETYTFEKQAEAMNDRIYVNPLISHPLEESPFKEEERKLPVELPYAQSETINVRLTLPEGYTVEEQPKGFVIKQEENGGTCRLLTAMEDGVFTLQFTLTLNQLYFAPDKYAGLKGFFDYVVQHQDELLILKKAS